MSSKLKVNDRVSTLHSGETVEGVIQEIFNDVLIIQLADKTLIKRYADSVELIENAPDPDTITISRLDLRRALAKVSDPRLYENDFTVPQSAIILNLVATLIGKNLEKELFSD